MVQCRCRGPIHHGVRRQDRGLTLVEMLAALVILGFMLTLVSQAVQQVSQLVRAAEATTRTVTAGWSGAWVLQPTLSNLVYPSEATDNGFKGGPERIEGHTNVPLSGAATGVQPFVLELRRSSGRVAMTEVWATSEGASPGQPRIELVAKLDGLLQFVFVGSSGQPSPMWPMFTGKPNDATDLVLPDAIALQYVDSRNILVRFAFEGEKLRPRPPSKPFWE
jgi:prepilin-type N-terminal cleavage/methylation domain-containing protein